MKLDTLVGLSAPFYLRIITPPSTNLPSAVNGTYVTPIAQNFENHFAFATKEKSRGFFSTEVGSLMYTGEGTGQYYATAGVYDVPDGLPILNLRDRQHSPEGYPHGWMFDHNEHLALGQDTSFYVCDYNGLTSVALYPNHVSVREECEPVFVIADLVYS